MKKIKKLSILVLALAMLALSACTPNNGGPGNQGENNGNGTEGPGYPNGENNGNTENGEIDWSLYPIIIDGKVGVTAEPFIPEGEYFPTHIPLVPVAQALNTTVNWNQDTGEVSLTGLKGAISFVVGYELFDVDGETVALLLPSMQIGDEIYVPITFFRNVFGMGSAFWASGHVHLYTEGVDDMY